MKTQSIRLQIDAEIIPATSLGGFTLGTPVRDIQELITGLGVWKAGSYQLVLPFEARYTFGEGTIALSVDVRNGKIFKIIAGVGYKGLLFNKIAPGILVGQAMQLEPRLYYSEAEEVILCKGISGLTLNVAEIDPPAHLVPNLAISAISVIAEEAFTASGQAGYW